MIGAAKENDLWPISDQISGTQCLPFEAINRSRHANRSPREVRRDRLFDRHVS